MSRSQAPVNILLVDDQPANLLTLEAVLDPLGQRLVRASNGDEALRQLLDQDFAVVLLDVRMPGLDGMETARIIRGRERTRHTPIIFLTAHGDDGFSAGRAYELGAVDFLVKPLAPEILRAKVAVFVELFQKTEQLRRMEREVAERRALEGRARLSDLRADVSAALAQAGGERAMLQRCAEALVHHLGAAFARVWTLNQRDEVLVLQASAGQYTHLDGSHSRVPVGSLKIGKIARDRRPHLSNDVARDPHIGDPDWASQEGMEAFAGYPLVVEDRLVGVIALFARHRLGPEILDALAAVADAVGQGIERRRSEEALREANRAKDDFLTMLSHELRNPLAPMLSSLHVLRLAGDDRPETSQAREVLERQVRHMARLVDDLLDVSRITRGKIRLRHERLDLARLARTTADDRRDPMTQSGLALVLDIPDTPVWVMGDPTRLAQVLTNLLDNAGKFTDRGGRVTVRVSADDERGQAVLTVGDTGIGIEREMLSRLFDVFSQADRSLERTRGGLGLGLALVKGLAELHGGEVKAISDGPGRGSEFVVRLPLVAEPAALAEVRAPRRAVQPLRLLVIEDNRDAAESLRLLLQLMGHEVNVAYTGPDGVDRAVAGRPDAVVSDIGLPGLDGYGVAAALRGHPETAHVRLIAVTGYGSAEDRNRALAAGFDHVLAKPADPAELQELLACPLGGEICDAPHAPFVAQSPLSSGGGPVPGKRRPDFANAD